ncbi:TetR/AcrR family transcriptional regulator [Pseudomonas cichorii]|uniref:TetR/AcrR family transcriptional regulator n=1 Tax=Pseudomonas cichorii TaxID=36746 RepID=UPI001C8A13D2|nr:TetR/AcrR family transcriptional regulator [Pseudomonas cichorii]MBX8513561.1 TetR/AcrR family transcriptional regulator [Pseudomonas cichorii]MBX8573767.1 TetR/AcrR family transcriptional regulator [Pseudomonas cichorii]
MKTVESKKSGRPLSFDRDVVLEKAMFAFWEHGYESTSMATLTKAMGVTAPSIYAAFGDKKQLFLEAVDLYLKKGMASRKALAANAAVRENVLSSLRHAVEMFTTNADSCGCLLATAAVSCSESAADVRDHLAAIRRGMEDDLVSTIRDGIQKGELPPGTDASVLAGFFMATIQGLAALARDGADRQRLFEILDVAMSVWPSPR